MIGIDSTEYKKLSKLCEKETPPQCPVCKKYIYITDIDSVEYIKTRAKTEIFIHTKCVRRSW